MNFPPPSEQQARLIWAALTGLAVALIVALVVATVWGCGRVLSVLGPVLWPLAVAGVLAYLLDPVVDFFERRRVPRTRSIVLVFFIAVMLVSALFASVVPRLVVETKQLVDNAPAFVAKAEVRFMNYIQHPPKSVQGILGRFGIRWVERPAAAATNAPAAEGIEPGMTNAAAQQVLEVEQESVAKVTDWITKAITGAGSWFGNRISKVTGLFGVVAGLALIPIYLFYFLLEKRSIADHWKQYVPVSNSQLREEVIFVLNAINEYLIAFFRGQVLVAICDGILYAIGFSIIGLPYAVVIGAAAMALTIIPFLGAIVTCGTALLIALVSFGDWQHPLMVLGVFAVVQGIEGYVLQPKILGDRVNLHPMVIIVSVIAGTTLLGGIMGGLLAIPFAAALRVVLFRYVWSTATETQKVSKSESSSSSKSG